MVATKRKASAPDAGAWLPLPHAPAPLRRWLEIQTSLSIAIAQRCPLDAPFRVTLLSQGNNRPLTDEAPIIGNPRHTRVHERDVLLQSGQHPLVYAHTVVRRDHLRHPWHHLLRIGSRPLGTLLFTHPGVSAGPLFYRQLDPRHPLWQRACAQLTRKAKQPVALPRRLWARRAVFTLDGSPLLVTEVFLPDIQNLPSP